MSALPETGTGTGTVLLPLVPLRGCTLQPGVATRLFIGRIGSQNAVRAAECADGLVFAVTQSIATAEVADLADLYPIGTVAIVQSQLRLPDGNLMVQISGQWRGRVLELVGADGHQAAVVEPVADSADHALEMGPPPVPIRMAADAPDDIVSSTSLAGFDPAGEPCLEHERGGGIWLLFEQMPPSWVPEEEYAHFGRCAGFGQELARAIGAPVVWDDRERFYIEHPPGDCIERVRDFLVAFRRDNEPASRQP